MIDSMVKSLKTTIDWLSLSPQALCNLTAVVVVIDQRDQTTATIATSLDTLPETVKCLQKLVPRMVTPLSVTTAVKLGTLPETVTSLKNLEMAEADLHEEMTENATTVIELVTFPATAQSQDVKMTEGEERSDPEAEAETEAEIAEEEDPAPGLALKVAPPLVTETETAKIKMLEKEAPVLDLGLLPGPIPPTPEGAVRLRRAETSVEEAPAVLKALETLAAGLPPREAQCRKEEKPPSLTESTMAIENYLRWRP